MHKYRYKLLGKTCRIEIHVTAIMECVEFIGRTYYRCRVYDAPIPASRSEAITVVGWTFELGCPWYADGFDDTELYMKIRDRVAHLFPEWRDEIHRLCNPNNG